MVNPDPAASTDWSGFYFGGHFLGASSDNFNADSSNVGVGLQAGYLYQQGMFVVGGELQASLSDNIYYGLTPGAGVIQGWSTAAKVRAGLAYGDVLIYGTGGVGLSQFRASGPVLVEPEYSLGASLGFGAEYFVTDTVSLRAEYLQTQYADFQSTIDGTGRSDQLVTRAVTFGVNNHF